MTKTEAEISVDSDVEPLSDVRLSALRTATARTAADAYGKIAVRKASAAGNLVLQFTSVPETVRAFFRSVARRERAT